MRKHLTILLNICTITIFLPWPLMLFLSTGGVESPGPESFSGKELFIVFVVLNYPSLLFLAYWKFGWTFLGLSGKKMTLISFVGIILALFVTGHMSAIRNHIRGITPRGYSLAGNEVYFRGKFVEETDIDMFTPYKQDKNYAKNGKYVWFLGKAIDKADPKTFQPLIYKGAPRILYWSDQNYVFFKGDIVNQANPSTFRPLFNDIKELEKWNIYWVDNKHIFYRGKVIKGVSSEGAKSIQGLYLRTIDKVFFRSKEIVGVHLESFTVLDSNYFLSKDKSKIYHREKVVLPMADVLRFRLFEKGGYATDDTKLYKVTRHIPPRPVNYLKPVSFTSLGRNYVISKDRVYYVTPISYNAVDINADIKSFRVLDQKPGIKFYDKKKFYDAKDASYNYREGKKWSPIKKDGQ